MAIARRSQVKVVLVSAKWFAQVEEELVASRRRSSGQILALGNTAKLVGDLDAALAELQKERDSSLHHAVEGLS